MRRLSEFWFRNLPIGGTMHLPRYMKDVHHADDVRDHALEAPGKTSGPILRLFAAPSISAFDVFRKWPSALLPQGSSPVPHAHL